MTRLPMRAGRQVAGDDNIPPTRDGGARSRRRRWPVVLLALAILPSFLLLRAIRALYVGQSSYEPVLAAQLYVVAYSVVFLVIPTLVVTRDAAVRDPGTLVLAALIGFVVLGALAPTIGEPNYCGSTGEYPSLFLDEARVPKVFRCTETPFNMAGLVGGWWVAFGYVRWRRRRRLTR